MSAQFIPCMRCEVIFSSALYLTESKLRTYGYCPFISVQMVQWMDGGMDVRLWVSVVALLWSGSWIMPTLLLFLHQCCITDQPLELYCLLLKNGLCVCVFVCVDFVWHFKIASTHTNTAKQQRVSPTPHPHEQCGSGYWAGNEVSTVYRLSWQRRRGPFIGGLTALESLLKADGGCKARWELYL